MRWIYWLGWMSFGAAYRTLFGLRIEGRENLITEGPVLVAANHQSFLDPPLIGNLYQEKRWIQYHDLPSPRWYDSGSRAAVEQACYARRGLPR